MKFQIPSIGDKIRLTRAWKFTLHAESRNESLGLLIDHFVKGETRYASGTWSDGFSGYGDWRYDPPIASGRAIVEVTLPKGTELTIDRIYIRKAAETFNSVSFNVRSFPETYKHKKKGRIRFWAKLNDVNKMNFEMSEVICKHCGELICKINGIWVHDDPDEDPKVDDYGWLKCSGLTTTTAEPK